MSKQDDAVFISVTPDMIVGNFDFKVDAANSEPKLKKGEYQCENCLGIFNYGWTDEEAEAEYQANFTEEANAGVEKAIVCDDCYKGMTDD